MAMPKSLCLTGGSRYLLKSDLSVWYPLEFDEETGAILPMRPLRSFELHLPVRARSDDVVEQGVS